MDELGPGFINPKNQHQHRRLNYTPDLHDYAPRFYTPYTSHYDHRFEIQLRCWSSIASFIVIIIVFVVSLRGSSGVFELRKAGNLFLVCESRGRVPNSKGSFDLCQVSFFLLIKLFGAGEVIPPSNYRVNLLGCITTDTAGGHWFPGPTGTFESCSEWWVEEDLMTWCWCLVIFLVVLCVSICSWVAIWFSGREARVWWPRVFSVTFLGRK